ncbi:putative pectinacetylesterase/NOTUM [Helianthus annuus]|nr:putative pectinacetylesterase/NOTUM [Helianthus annuus]
MVTFTRLCQWLCLILLMLLKTECSDKVNITFLKSAVAKGADGSPPAYQLDEGFGDGVDKWLIHIQVKIIRFTCSYHPNNKVYKSK